MREQVPRKGCTVVSVPGAGENAPLTLVSDVALAPRPALTPLLTPLLTLLTSSSNQQLQHARVHLRPRWPGRLPDGKRLLGALLP